MVLTAIPPTAIMHCKELNTTTFLITEELQVQFHKNTLAHAVTLAYVHTLKGVSVIVFQIPCEVLSGQLHVYIKNN